MGFSHRYHVIRVTCDGVNLIPLSPLAFLFSAEGLLRPIPEARLFLSLRYTLSALSLCLFSPSQPITSTPLLLSDTHLIHLRDMANITEDDEQCPVCRPTGPPSTSTSVTTSHPHQENGHGQAEAGAGALQGGEINWIACTKCQVWFHSVCVARKMDNTLPVVLKEEMDNEGGEWWDWTKRVNRWSVLSLPSLYGFPILILVGLTLTGRYCSRCQALPSTSHPLTTTLKPQVSKTDRTRRRSSGGGTQADAATAMPRSPKPKKARMDSLSPPPPLSRPSTSHPPPPPRSTDSPLSDPPAPTPPTLTEQPNSRPKRQAALNRPDYHAMHNHIATPTARWLELIKEPGKYGTSISPGESPPSFLPQGRTLLTPRQLYPPSRKSAH